MKFRLKVIPNHLMGLQNSPIYIDNINILSYDVSLKCNATAIFVKSDHDILFISFDQTMSY